MHRIYLLHLSDLHLAGLLRTFYGSLGNITPLSVYNPDVLTAVSEIIYKWCDNIDAILISGDIATTGFSNDLRYAREVLSAPDNYTFRQCWLTDKRKPTLKPQGFNKPIILLPGNHDRYANLTGFPSDKFYRYFYSYWSAGIGGIQSCFLPNRATPVLSVVSADFSLDAIGDSSCPRTGGHFGQGKVYKDRLISLVEETERISKSYPDCGIIWTLHFAPEFEKHYGLDHKMILLDADDLIKAAERVEVRYILCGHTHRFADYVTMANGGIEIHCAGSSTCLGNDQDTTIHLRLIELPGAGVVRVRSKTYFYDPDRQIFSDSP